MINKNSDNKYKTHKQLMMLPFTHTKNRKHCSSHVTVARMYVIT